MKEFALSDITFYAFESEKELNKKLLKDIDFFMGTVFKEKVKYATDKKYEVIGSYLIGNGQFLPKRGYRLDLWVECESGNKYIIEIKNQKKERNTTLNAIGQILRYSIRYPDAKLVIVSTGYDDGIYEILTKYNLPIDFVLITEKQTFLLKKNGNTKTKKSN